jgi:hypothetical protein
LPCFHKIEQNNDDEDNIEEFSHFNFKETVGERAVKEAEDDKGARIY